MPTVYLSPIGNGFQFLTSGGVPLNGGLIATYAAGTTTPQATFTTNTGTVTSANPIVLGSDGRPTTEIWLTAGQSYKFLLADSLSSSIATYDNLYGINDPAAPVSNQNPIPITSVAGTANAITGAIPGNISAFAAQQLYLLIPASTNTSAVAITLTPSGGSPLSARNIFLNGSALGGGELRAGIPTILEDDGTQLNIVGNSYLVAGTSASSVTTAAALNLDVMSGDYGQLLGVTQITSVILAPGRERTLLVANQVNISSTVSLVLPGSVGITANTGDIVVFRGETTSNARVVSVQRAARVNSVVAVQDANLVFAGPTTGVSSAPSFRSLTAADLPLASTVTSNFLSGNIALNNTAAFFDGPTVTQGTVGTWFAMGTVTLSDNNGAADYTIKLTDGTTVISSSLVRGTGGVTPTAVTLSGVIASPVGNLRISVKDITSTGGFILSNASGLSKDSGLTVMRIG